MNWFVVILILILALAGIGTIWHVSTQSSCKLPDKNTCTGTSTTGSGRLQVPYCADDTSKHECEDPETLCGTIPADCNSPYCDYVSKKWVCSTGSQKYSCVKNTCQVDINGKYSSIQDCSKDCSPDQSCTPSDGNLPYPVTDGSTVYTTFTKVPDQYGTYKYISIGSESACQLSCDTKKSKLMTDTNGIWCDPLDDGSNCSIVQLKSIKGLPIPPETYKGTYPDANANYVLAYMNYNNTNQYCKFNSCLQPSYKLGTDGVCFKKCTITDPYAIETDDKCKITKCSKGQPKTDGTACDISARCTPIQFATGYDANCNPTGCSDPTDSITVYRVDPTGKFCTGKTCTQPSGDFYQYTNTGTLGKCVKTNQCIPNSDPRKQYDPNNNCNAICTGDSCKAFIGVAANAGYTFACDSDSSGRSCTVHNDGTGWGGCGSVKYPQYGPTGTGTCALTVFEQRSRFNDGTDTASPMGCITCLGGASGTDCNPWQTDINKCSYAEGCTFGQDKHFGKPEDALSACVNDQQKYYTFSGDITTLSTGEQIRSVLRYNLSFYYTSNPDVTIHYNGNPIPKEGLNVTFMKNSPYILISGVINGYGWYLKTNVLADYMQTNGYSSVFINVSDPDDDWRAKFDNIVFDNNGKDKKSDFNFVEGQTPTILSPCNELSENCVNEFKWW